MKKVAILLLLLCTGALNSMENPTHNHLQQQNLLLSKQLASKKVDIHTWVTLAEKLYKGSSFTEGDMLALYINKEDLPSSYTGLKELFATYNITTYDHPSKWTDDTWKKAYAIFQDQQTKAPKPYSINVREIPSLLETAKAIVKAFLPDDSETPTIINTFLEKPFRYKSLNRLFTYTYLNLVIIKQKLTHITLPRKVILIQNKKTKQYVSKQEAQKIIDDSLKMCVYSNKAFVYSEVNGQILFLSDTYELKFFANKELKDESGLSSIAINELTTLCGFAPFDIGGQLGQRNMFRDNDNAIIIDTEYLGEPSSNACPKLGRYR